ncbi:hypothetical protein GOP47_0012497 [Adiantum capillus-veneris]|uniref:J domain-containing protein n=1 Tax=Adiantum capillus-veneris TaxID=13818 RepID=A0A9D4URG0_ADICA|nr:hypothetical protein GOP47_0012497 [Adiantum capillus-veneris]
MPRKSKRAERKQDDEEEATSKEAAQEAPTSASLYEVLGVERTATHEEIRKAYHRLALRLHPDKNPGDQNAKEKFQALQDVIAVLGDPEKRKVYDETGSTEDAELSNEVVQGLYQFFKAVFKPVTEDDIEEFAASYQGSESETQDLKNLYTKCKGNMDIVFDRLMCSDPQQDSHRFMDLINEAISAGELKEYDVYKRWAKKIAKKPRPVAQKRPKRGKTSEGSEASLFAIISNRQKQRNSMDSLAAALEAKYSGNEKSKKSKVKHQEPSEEEFEAAQKRIAERMKARGK